MKPKRLTENELLGIAALHVEGVHIQTEGGQPPTSSDFRHACRKLDGHILWMEPILKDLVELVTEMNSGTAVNADSAVPVLRSIWEDHIKDQRHGKFVPQKPEEFLVGG